MKGTALADCTARLEKFAERYKPLFRNKVQRPLFEKYLKGLIGPVPRKSIEPIALEQGVPVKALQRFIGQAPWDDERVLEEHTRHVGETLGEDQGILILDSTAAPKRGEHSVGVKRQWCSPRGKEENCQVWVNLEYASQKGHTLVNRRLYMPQEWCQDRARRRECGIPEEVEFRTGGDLAYELVSEARQADLPHAWVTGDEEFGKAGPLQKRLEALDEQYIFELASNTRVWVSLPKGPQRKPGGLISRLRHVRAGRPRSIHVKDLAKELSPKMWREYSVRAGSKGPIIVRAALLRVHYGQREERWRGARWLLIGCNLSQKGEIKYFKSNAPQDATLETMLPAAYARWSIEQSHRQGKKQTGLADYETRSWRGWHHHTALAMLAHHFLVCERIRLGKKIPRDDHRGVRATLQRSESRGLQWLIQIQERAALSTRA